MKGKEDISLTREQALTWGEKSGSALDPLYRNASSLRDFHWGRKLTYSRKVFIPLTNLCRDTCGYCTFVKDPSFLGTGYLTPEKVLEIAFAGKKAGCKEALFSLGEKPEKKYFEAREALKSLSYSSTIAYLRDMCELVLDETGLIPHANPGTMTQEEICLLKPVTGSMGMMLESISPRLLQNGQAHAACPDKVPNIRLETLRNAGKEDVPFTTGILIGIGETWEERIDTLFAIEEIHKEFGHIQEVIIQNFKAKKDIRMANWLEPSHEEMLKTIAVARLILSSEISVQAPPNLSENYIQYIQAGLNDWGGISPVTLDHINPERAWPQIEEMKGKIENAGYELVQRMTVYPRFLKNAERYLSPSLLGRGLW